MIPTRLAAVANSKGLIHDWLLGSGAVTATASDMLGTVQKQQTIFPILLLNEGQASFDPFVPQPTCQSPCLLTMVNQRPLWVSKQCHTPDFGVKHSFLFFSYEGNHSIIPQTRVNTPEVSPCFDSATASQCAQCCAADALSATQPLCYEPLCCIPPAQSRWLQPDEPRFTTVSCQLMLVSVH